jgi:thiol:disulfide interchange protein
MTLMAGQHLKASLAALFALLVAAAFVAVGSGLLPGFANSDRFPWRDYTPDLISRLRKEQTPLLVHFVADWDVVVHSLRMHVIETPEVRRAVDRHNYTCVLVDCSGLSGPHRSVPPIWEEIEALGIKHLPVTVVIPPGKKRPIVFQGMVTKERLVAALNGENLE